MKQSLKTFKRSITLAIITPLLLIIVITSIIFRIINNQRHEENYLSAKKQISSINALFQSSLSEKLAIIASSNVFIDFITSGELTRKEIMLKFLEQLSTIHSDSIQGLRISNTERENTFTYGNISNVHITLKLCYLANHLDNKNGKCNYLLTIFFSKNEFINELKAINNELIFCKNCELTNLFNLDTFGSFSIADKSPFFVGLKLQEGKNNLFYYYFLIIFLLMLFALLNNVRLRRIINDVISTPLSNLVDNVKNDTVIEANNTSLQEINYLMNQIFLWKKRIKASQEIEKQVVLLNLAASVAHDICSPISVIEMTIGAISKNVETEDVLIIQEALHSIRDITNNLLVKYRQVDSLTSLTQLDFSSNLLQTTGHDEQFILLYTHLQICIAQKHQEWRDNSCKILLEIDPATKFLWSKCSPNEIKRILSNLLNNAYEALRENKHIFINLKSQKNELLLSVYDMGVGIPSSMINNVLQGASSKHLGRGLGLSKAKIYMESIGGKLQLISKNNQFTKITLIFPNDITPGWFPQKISLPTNSCVAVLDDDPAIHNLWRHLFQDIEINVVHFSKSEDLIFWYKRNEDIGFHKILFVDYDLGSETDNGLLLLKRLNAKRNGYLVTNHAENILLQNAVEKEELWLIPKSLIRDIELTVITQI